MSVVGGDQDGGRRSWSRRSFSFCSRPADGAAPLKPGDVVRWMLPLHLAASSPPPPSTWVDLSNRTKVNAAEKTAARRISVALTPSESRKATLGFHRSYLQNLGGFFQKPDAFEGIEEVTFPQRTVIIYYS